MRDHDDVPHIVIERSGAGVGAFFWGALIGAGIALLLAPRTGAQTQADLRAGVRRVRATAEDSFDSARDTVNRTRDRFEGRVESVRDRVEERTDRARGAADRARRATGGAREEIERRLANAREGRSTAGAPAGSPPPPAEQPVAGQDDPEIVVTDVSEERIEGRSEFG